MCVCFNCSVVVSGLDVLLPGLSRSLYPRSLCLSVMESMYLYLLIDVKTKSSTQVTSWCFMCRPEGAKGCVCVYITFDDFIIPSHYRICIKLLPMLSLKITIVLVNKAHFYDC